MEREIKEIKLFMEPKTYPIFEEILSNAGNVEVFYVQDLKISTNCVEEESWILTEKVLIQFYINGLDDITKVEATTFHRDAIIGIKRSYEIEKKNQGMEYITSLKSASIHFNDGREPIIIKNPEDEEQKWFIKLVNMLG